MYSKSTILLYTPRVNTVLESSFLNNSNLKTILDCIEQGSSHIHKVRLSIDLYSPRLLKAVSYSNIPNPSCSSH